MDAAQAILLVIGPVGAAAVAFGKILLDRHLRTIEQTQDGWKEFVVSVVAELKEERAAREQSELRVLDAIESLRRQTNDRFDESEKHRETALLAVVTKLEDKRISGLTRAVRERAGSRPDEEERKRK